MKDHQLTMTFYIFHTAPLYTYVLFSLINGIIVPCHSRHERAVAHSPQNFLLANLECQSKCEFILKWSKFNSTPAQLEVLSTLNSSNMKKNWIDGRISYSSLVYWLLCLPVAEYTTTTNIENNSFYTCSNFGLHQSDQIVDYIGLSVNDCYCLETINGQTAVNDNHCSEKCRKQDDNTSVNENCGSHGYIGIYKLYNRDIQFDSVDISPGDQCVAVTMETGRYHYQLQHCKHSTISFACEDQVRANINKTGFHDDMCEWINRHYTCILHNLTNWVRARNNCLSRNSRLVWDTESSFEQNLFHSNTWYWTGIFRTSSITESETDRVSVTADVKCRVLNAESATVTVQNCSDQSPYICYMHQHNTINHDRNGTPNSHIQPYVLVIITILSLAIAIAIAILTLKRQKYRRNKGNNYRNTQRPNLTETEELVTSTSVNVDNRKDDNVAATP